MIVTQEMWRRAEREWITRANQKLEDSPRGHVWAILLAALWREPRADLEFLEQLLFFDDEGEILPDEEMLSVGELRRLLRDHLKPGGTALMAAEKDVDVQAIRESARDIVDSEAFMWMMVGASHAEAHLETLRDKYQRYWDLGGGYNGVARRRQL